MRNKESTLPGLTATADLEALRVCLHSPHVSYEMFPLGTFGEDTEEVDRSQAQQYRELY